MKTDSDFPIFRMLIFIFGVLIATPICLVSCNPSYVTQEPVTPDNDNLEFERIDNVKKVFMHSINHWSFLVESGPGKGGFLMDFKISPTQIKSQSSNKNYWIDAYPSAMVYWDVEEGGSCWIEVGRKHRGFGEGHLSKIAHIKVHVYSFSEILGGDEDYGKFGSERAIPIN